MPYTSTNASKGEMKTLNSMTNQKMKEYKKYGYRKTFIRLTNDNISSIIVTALTSNKSGNFVYVDDNILTPMFKFRTGVRLNILSIKSHMLKYSLLLLLIITTLFFSYMFYEDINVDLIELIVMISSFNLIVLSICLSIDLFNTYNRVLTTQNDISVEDEMAITIGHDTKEAMLAAELAVYYINEYTDKTVIRIAFEEDLDPLQILNHADENFNSFANDMHLKSLIDARGRSFQIAGILSALISSYRFMIMKIMEGDLSSEYISKSAKLSIDKYTNEPNSDIIKKLKEFLDTLTKESTFDHDLLDSIDLSDLFIVPLLCKDKLLSLKEVYSKFDSI